MELHFSTKIKIYCVLVYVILFIKNIIKILLKILLKIYYNYSQIFKNVGILPCSKESIGSIIKHKGNAAIIVIG